MLIKIVPLGFNDTALINVVAKSIEQVFGAGVVISSTDIPLEAGRDTVRRQVNSTWLLSQLLTSFPDGADKLMGITSEDLFSPVLTYVFGEAELDGRAAVLSVHRFRDELYGLPPNPDKLRSRVIKEATHELGHVFGLRHCYRGACVMHACTYAEEIDFKMNRFCSACSAALPSCSSRLGLRSA